MATQPQIATEEFGPQEQVNVLLKEYDTLRAEIIARTNNCYQLCAAAAAALAWLTGRANEWTLWALYAFLFLISAGVAFALYRDINALCSRVSTIEKGYQSSERRQRIIGVGDSVGRRLG
jgi:hypothetical protein